MFEGRTKSSDRKKVAKPKGGLSSILAKLSNPRPSPPLPPGAGPSDSMRSAARAGWIIVALFFGLFGTWAVSAPLNGAVVANAVVKVDGNRKSVQHLDGGIVKRLNVKEGDEVKAGDVLVILDDSQARAEYEVLSEQYVVLRLTDERLRTEYRLGAQLNFPGDVKDFDSADVQNVWNTQLHQFDSRRAALEGQRKVVKEKIAQLKAQITGSEAQVRAYHQQYDSVQAEKVSIEPLVRQGLISRPRYLQLERSGVSLEGQAAEATANIAKLRQGIAEQEQQMGQIENDHLADIAKDLRETQAKLLEVIPRRMNAKAILSRIEIRAPYTGRVVGLNVFSVGGVINRGDKILDIVPGQDSLVLEAQIAVDDISDVHPDMGADIHLTAYKQRITPVVHGEVIQVSADRLTDNRTGNPYYIALVKIDEKDLAALPEVKLYPGMPATVLVRTVERTAFDYLVGPLTMSFQKAFRQK
jgi:HlyD family type I secretion membrane fusion protein